ncbi:hypothetical protein GA0070624_1823 [Micromonospora rhizosphaerae]|uniref:Flavin reductase n=1 Tax=Micromonospora rhizosphaerae TaxID=568872 RepID=A0A1C6RRC7_9ACTN|nr:hypothetical protein [Micromonospora rhizosphaerae]SCL19715.1 hypothetical protein GA0070624_1823 [Micromonospora rhizosphaerae]
MTAHAPVPPLWNCAGCGVGWPCPTRRRELRAEFEDAPVSLALYMSSHFVRAAEDLVGVPAGQLHQRFVGWVRGDEQVHQHTERHLAGERPRFRRRRI